MALPDPIVIGQPADDTGCNLLGYIYRPDPVLYPPPRPAVVGTVAGLFKQGTMSSLNAAFTELSAKGFICMSFQVRLTEPGQLPDQTTDGKYPQQTDDMEIGIRYMRALTDECNGFVATLGGSASGHHALYKCLSGTLGDDLADAGVGLSPVTDMGDREADVTEQFIDTVEFYGRTDNLATLTSISPIALIETTVHPIPPMMFCCGTNESMPYSQLTRFSAALDQAGATNYVARTNTTTEHSYKTWFEVKFDVLEFLLNAVSMWGGGGTAPQQGFRLTLEGGPYTIVGAFNNNLLPESARSATITGLDPATFYTAELIHYDQELVSPAATAEFTTGMGGLKGYPFGAYKLLSAPGGDFFTDFIDGDVTTTYAHVKGYRGRLQLPIVVPGPLGVYDWSGPDAALDVIEGVNKKLGLSCGIGVTATAEWYDEAGDFPVAKIAIDLDDITPQAYQPVFWDPNHLTKMEAFVTAFGAKYDSHTSISYIVLSGFMQGTQGFVSQTDEDDAKWDQAALDFGFADKIEAYVFAAQTITGYFLASFPNTPLFFSTGRPFNDSDGGEAQSIFIDWIENSTNHRCGVMTTGLHATEPPHQPPATPTLPKGAQAIFSSADEARFYGDVPPDPYPTPPQLVDDLMKASAVQGRAYVEIYALDIDNIVNAAVITENNLILQSILPEF